MSAITDRINFTQQLVSRYERGEINFERLKEHVPVLSGPILSGEEVEFAVAIYELLRPREAVAYQYRQRPLTSNNPILYWIREGLLLLAEIENRLLGIGYLETSSYLEEVGKLFIEEKLIWARRVLTESFSSWGVSQGDSS